jgi:DNA-binding transcriptional MocR family regulator
MDEAFGSLARRAAEEVSDRPLYLRLAERLERRLHSVGPAGLPSARRLAAVSGISRATVTAAYRELARRRLIELKVGRPPRHGRRPPPVETGFDPPQGAVDLARYAPDAELLPAGDVFTWLGLGGSEGEGEGVAQYGSARGFAPLRGWLAERLRRLGMKVRAEEIVLTSGVQHGLDLLLRAFTRPGDAVVVEDPTYPGLPPLLAAHQVRPLGVPVIHSPADPEELCALAKAAGARLAVLTPTLHNPTGLVMDQPARERLLAGAASLDTLVVEEFFDPALVGEGPVPPPLGALSPAVVTVGSFSKSLFPGLRVGWLTGPGAVVEAVVAVKRATDLSGSPFLEAAAWTLCQRGVLDAQLERLRHAAVQRRREVLQALAGAPAGVRWTHPAGGFSLLVSLPPQQSSRAVAQRAARRGVWVLPGPAMSVSGRDDLMRVAYAAVGGAPLRRAVEEVVGALGGRDTALPLV